MNSIVRLCAGLPAIACLVFVAGCDAHDKVVAEVNRVPITETLYNERVQGVTAFPQGMSLDAGGLTMVNMIRDQLTEQLAAKTHAVPSEEMVNAATDYQLRMDPKTNADIMTGKVSRDDLRRQKKYELEAFGIGTNGDKPTDQELDTTYEEFKNRPEFHVKAAYTVKLLQVPDDATGRRVIADLKQTGDFKGAAQKLLSLTAVVAATAGKEQTLMSDQLRPELLQALRKLKPNEITPEPVAIKYSDPQQPTAPPYVYAVAQLKKMEPERALSKIDVNFLLAPLVLKKTHPDWIEHYRRELADFTRKSQIRIALQRYENLVDTFVRPVANAESAPRPAAGGEAPQPGSSR